MFGRRTNLGIGLLLIVLVVPTYAMAHATTGSHSVGALEWKGRNTSLTGTSSSTADIIVAVGTTGTATVSWSASDGPSFRSGYIVDNNVRWVGAASFSLNDGGCSTSRCARPTLTTNWNNNAFASGTLSETKGLGFQSYSVLLSNGQLNEQRFVSGIGWGNTGTFIGLTSRSAVSSLTIL
ncbi:MAG: hypothetical protein ACT4PT_06155 [Methanobacteriota archaeon]